MVRPERDRSSPLPTLLRAREAAEMLAVSPRKLWELTNRGLVPCVRIGRAVRYDVRDLAAWIDEQKSGPIPGESA